MSSAYSNSQLDALAFLPPEDVKEGMAHLRSTMPEEAAPLLEYFDSTYISGQLRHHRPVTSRPASCIKPLHLRRTTPMFPIEKWNMHHITLNNQPRNNNICEAWNNKFFRLVGHSNPTVWKIIECLRAEASNVDAALSRMNVAFVLLKEEKKKIKNCRHGSKTLYST